MISLRKSIEENALELAKKHTYKERTKIIIELYQEI